MLVKYDEMREVFKKILIKKGFNEDISERSSKIFADNSLDGVYSHGVNRFPRVLSYIEKGYIDPNATIEVTSSFGAVERWNANLGMGNTTAQSAMDRAIELAQAYGIGMVALSNTNHWMRGGTYGWQAAEKGMIGICFTNTMPNMPAWGTKESNIGNNPFIFAIPRSNGEHIVADLAMAQFSYGKLEETRLKGKNLPVSGGYDKDGNLSVNPAEIEESRRVLPIGYWKGSGLSIVLDLAAAIISGGNTSYRVSKISDEDVSVSQILIAINPKSLGTSKEQSDELIEELILRIKSSEKSEASSDIRYPGESTYKIRQNNLQNGIPVVDEIWNKILSEL